MTSVDRPVTVQAGIDERIRELFGQHPAELARLVDQAVERELAELVEQRLANGNGFPTDLVTNPDRAGRVDPRLRVLRAHTASQEVRAGPPQGVLNLPEPRPPGPHPRARASGRPRAGAS